jgi:hypothetical protein
MTETVQVFLSSSQKKKFEKGETFQLSASQLQSGTGKFHVEIEMTTKNHKELLRNVSKNKGYRFTSAKVVGGSILGNIAKNIGKKIAKKGVGKILDKIGEKTGQKGITNFIKDEAVDGLIDFGADKISGGKMQKGSPEMREHMARLRSMRKSKGKGMTDNMVDEIDGGSIASDFRNFGRKVKRTFTKTFTPKLGREIKRALTSKDAKEVYKGIADFGIGTAAAFTGRPIVGAIGAKLANRAIDGLGLKGKPNTMVIGGTLVNGVPSVQIRGKGFNSKDGTHYGGSFKSAGGSMISP